MPIVLMAENHCKDLTTAFISMMDMPVVVAAGLKGYVENWELTILEIRQRVKKTLPDKILLESIVRDTLSEHVCRIKYLLCYNG